MKRLTIFDSMFFCQNQLATDVIGVEGSGTGEGGVPREGSWGGTARGLPTTENNKSEWQKQKTCFDKQLQYIILP